MPCVELEIPIPVRVLTIYHKKFYDWRIFRPNPKLKESSKICNLSISILLFNFSHRRYCFCCIDKRVFFYIIHGLFSFIHAFVLWLCYIFVTGVCLAIFLWMIKIYFVKVNFKDYMCITNLLQCWLMLCLTWNTWFGRSIEHLIRPRISNEFHFSSFLGILWAV